MDSGACVGEKRATGAPRRLRVRRETDRRAGAGRSAALCARTKLVERLAIELAPRVVHRSGTGVGGRGVHVHILGTETDPSSRLLEKPFVDKALWTASVVKGCHSQHN